MGPGVLGMIVYLHIGDVPVLRDFQVPGHIEHRVPLNPRIPLPLSQAKLLVFDFFDLRSLRRGNAIRNELAKRTGRTSMPNIFVKVGQCTLDPGLKAQQHSPGFKCFMVKRITALSI